MANSQITKNPIKRRVDKRQAPLVVKKNVQIDPSKARVAKKSVRSKK